MKRQNPPERPTPFSRRDFLRGGALVSLGAAAAPATYEAGPFELDVLRSATGALVGELLATDDERLAGGTCTLFGQELVRSTMLTEHGHFRFEDVPPGTYRLVLELEGQGSIVVSDLSL